MASNTVTVNSTITGIHKTKVGAHREIALAVEDDDSIPNIDPNCMLVRFPDLEDIPQRLHKAVTYPKNPEHKRFFDQLVEDVVGQKVGNVPANICGLFRKLKRDGLVRRIQWYAYFLDSSRFIALWGIVCKEIGMFPFNILPF